MKTISPKTKYGFLNEQDKLFPPMVVLEITNVCNADCIHCPHTLFSKDVNYKPKHMNWELFEKIVDEVSAYENIIFRLLSDGEPMMHPRFLEMLEFAKNKGIAPINFITNGMFLDENAAKRIIDAKIDVVEISLDALTKPTYQKIRKGLDYDTVISNVHRFIDMKNKSKAGTKILVSVIDQPEASLEIQDFIDYWQPIVDKVIKRTFTSIGGLVRDKRPEKVPQDERWPCPQLWRRLFVNIDGYAEFCVEDWCDKTVIGDVNTHSIKQIWRSESYDKIRDHHLAKQFSKVDYCAQCCDWQARDWDYNYFFALKKLFK
jgi:MoaA/NifB/PqqE/SkfB family radical SAM enzyme